MSSKLRVLVIGGVACGPKTASRLKRLMPDADITMIEKGELVSYGACGLPYYVEGVFNNIKELTHTPVGVPRTPAFFEKAKGFKTLIRTEAIKIDRKNKTVRVKYLDSGTEEDLPYDKLVLGTGGSPACPPIPGIDLKNVWFMTHLDDAETLVKEIESQNLKRAVIVGAGLIGIETAEALINRGLDVTLIAKYDQIMPKNLDKDIADFAAVHLEDNDLNLAFEQEVTEIKGDQGKVSSVETDKQSISADLVVIAIGTRPNAKLAIDAGLDCRGAIVVNEYCQTSDKDIYAGGDCVFNRYADKVLGGMMYAPMGSTANKHGRVIANHIAGMPTPFTGITGTTVVKAFDYAIGRTGLTEKMARDLNLDIEVTTWAGADLPNYLPESRQFIIKMIASRRDRKLLGVQVAGMGDCVKRLDVAASVVLLGGTLDDISDIDFAYAPPYGPAIDPLATCAHILTNKLDGVAKGISAAKAKALLDKGDAVLLDVRLEDEFKLMKLPYDAILIPLGALRERVDELPRDKDILTVCKVSLRGYEAQRILNAAGFDRVQFIEGGLQAWPFEMSLLGL